MSKRSRQEHDFGDIFILRLLGLCQCDQDNSIILAISSILSILSCVQGDQDKSMVLMILSNLSDLTCVKIDQGKS
jgi:hypothetical protein